MSQPSDLKLAELAERLAAVARFPRRESAALTVECAMLLGNLCSTDDEAEALTAALIRAAPPAGSRWNFPAIQAAAERIQRPTPPHDPSPLLIRERLALAQLALPGEDEWQTAERIDRECERELVDYPQRAALMEQARAEILNYHRIAGNRAPEPWALEAQATARAEAILWRRRIEAALTKDT